MSKGHGADLIYWSTHQGRNDPAEAIATLREGRVIPIDHKLIAIMKAGAGVKLGRNQNGLLVLDVGFLGDTLQGAVTLPQLEEATQAPQKAQGAILENPTQQTAQISWGALTQLERLHELSKIKPVPPQRMAAYLEACK
ncbi:hypothetical protein CJP16_10560 [Aeromonas sobria]|uniref:Uncharacterized protein n=1 Tax=Aeromonas sobria TaxID=646 RepID=A0A2N3IZA6_AERSO|nr:hypothetical protein [Aeromonas sobria]PKQ78363.1 hypothetical protein CJP16_10560 [Aeromonas sobria]